MKRAFKMAFNIIHLSNRCGISIGSLLLFFENLFFCARFFIILTGTIFVNSCKEHTNETHSVTDTVSAKVNNIYITDTSEINKILKMFNDTNLDSVSIILRDTITNVGRDTIKVNELPKRIRTLLKLKKESNDSIFLKFETKIYRDPFEYRVSYKYLHVDPYIVLVSCDIISKQKLDSTDLSKLQGLINSYKKEIISSLKANGEANLPEYVKLVDFGYRDYREGDLKAALDNFLNAIASLKSSDSNSHDKLGDDSLILQNAYLGCVRVYYRYLLKSDNEANEQKNRDIALKYLDSAIKVNPLIPEAFAYKALVLNTKINWERFDVLMLALRRREISITNQNSLESILGDIGELERTIMELNTLFSKEEYEKGKSADFLQNEKEAINSLLLRVNNMLILNKPNIEYAKRTLGIKV